MSSAKHGLIWPAKPHTIAKVRILQAYLKSWFSILGTKRPGERLLYVDGFAGPGEYQNYSTGSPIAAIEAANSAVGGNLNTWVAKEIQCVFMESDPERAAHLESKIKQTPINPIVKVQVLSTMFAEGIAEIAPQFPQNFSGQFPLFVFVDPFGATGVPFRTIANLLKSPSSEVLINLDADGIDRIWSAGEKAAADKNLTEVFGSEIWRNELTGQGPKQARYQKVLNLYRRCLKSLPDVRYTFAFEMLSSISLHNYYLVFASRVPLGLEKMKEAMRSVGQQGEYLFSDAAVAQMKMFQVDAEAEMRESARKMFEWCKGQRVAYQDIIEFVLNETPFLKAGRLLRYMKKESVITQIEPTPSFSGRDVDFDESSVAAIVFATTWPQKLFE